MHVSHRKEARALSHYGARREVALLLGRLVLLGQTLELAVHAEAHRAARTLPPVLLRAQVVPCRRRVQQALERAVDEARVADVVQPGARDLPAAIDSNPPLQVRAGCEGRPRRWRRWLWRWAPALATAGELVPCLPVCARAEQRQLRAPADFGWRWVGARCHASACGPRVTGAGRALQRMRIVAAAAADHVAGILASSS